MAKTIKMTIFLFFFLISVAITTQKTHAAQSPSPVSAPAASPFSSSVPEPFSPASSAAPTPGGLDCTNSLLNMTSCLTYVEDGSNLTVPETGCCGELASLVDNQPVCLCQLLASGETFGVKIDTTKALMLPTSCKVQTPPVSLCAVFGIPVASPLGPAPAPVTGGPMEPGTGSESTSPAAAPLSNNSVSAFTRGTTLLALIVIGLSIIAIL